MWSDVTGELESMTPSTQQQQQLDCLTTHILIFALDVNWTILLDVQIGRGHLWWTQRAGSSSPVHHHDGQLVFLASGAHKRSWGFYADTDVKLCIIYSKSTRQKYRQAHAAPL